MVGVTPTGPYPSIMALEPHLARRHFDRILYAASVYVVRLYKPRAVSCSVWVKHKAAGK